MDHWYVRGAWARNGLFILECPNCMGARACWEWRGLLPLIGVWILTLTQAYRKRKSLTRFLHLLLAVTASPSVMTPWVHGETVFDCTDPANTITDIDLSVVSECPDFQRTYAKVSLVNVLIIQRTSSTLIETYTCNLIVSREVCHCK